MEHLDEGTIHAWIDGALDTKQSGEIDAHVAKCPTCSAAVAEARGLIAASSRILTALDDVPGGVVPKRAPAVAPTAARPLRRRIGTWVPALAAAALIVAVGLQVNGRRGATLNATLEEAAQDSMRGFRANLARTVADTTLAQPPAAVAAIRDQGLESARKRAESRVIAAAGGAGAGPAGLQRANPAAPSVLPQPEAAVASKLESAPLRSAAEPTVAAAAPADSSGRRADRVGFMDIAAVPRTLAGCYRVEREDGESTLEKSANIAGAAARTLADSRAAQQRSRAPAAAPPAAQTMTADRATFALPAVVRLDTTARPLGLPVLAERKDSVIGWWTRAGQDTVRVRFLAGVAVTLTAGNRVDCPSR